MFAHVLVLAAAALGAPIRADGYGRPYQAAVCLGSMAYGLAGMLLTFRLCREWFTAQAALLGTVVAWMGTGAVYYLAVENSLSHACAIAVVTALVALWRFGRDLPSAAYWGGMGALAGFAACVRPQDGAFVLLPAISLLATGVGLVRARRRDAVWGGVAGPGFLLAAGVAVGYAPQLVVAQLAYGSPLRSGYSVHGESFSWGSPHVLGVLGSNWHGLLSWHPVLAAGLAGLAVLGRRDARYALALAAAFAVQVFIVASWVEWWGGDAFGGRMLLSCTPIFALGLTGAISWARGRGGRRLVLAVAGAALVWNGLFMAQYRSGAIFRAHPVSWSDITVGKVTFIPDEVRSRLR